MNEKSFFENKITCFNFLNIAIKRWYITVSVTLICLILSLIYSLMNIAPTYTCSAKLYIISRTQDDLSTSDMSVSQSLARDFELIINDDSIINEVAEAINYKYSSSQIKKAIEIDNPESTRVIDLSVETDNPQISKQIISSICEVSQEKVINIMGVDSISIISQGNITVNPARIRQLKIISVGGLAGLGISAAIIYLLAFSSNKISTGKEVEELLKLNVLATIPYNKNKRNS